MCPNRLALLAGIACAALGALPRHATAQPCAANVPHIHGQWTTLPYSMPINPISATLLRDGRVLIVAGSENDGYNDGRSYRNAVWDPSLPTQDGIEVQSMQYDVFCSGTATLFDGRPLVVGGTSDYSFTGESRASIFDPATSEFLQTQGMADGRWYATTTMLGDGRIMAFSGLRLNGSTSRTVEIFDLRNVTPWSSAVTAPFTPPLYPRMFLLPSGKVFFTGHGASSLTRSWIFDPGPRTWTQSAAVSGDRGYGTATLLPLYPPAYTPKVMTFGGGDPATATTQIIDLSAGSPSWSSGPVMSTGRIEMNATILPNGKILAAGGSVSNETPDAAGRSADLYDPANPGLGFAPAGAAAFSRLYHSVALLLPDATVATIGSNPGARGRYEPAIEIYTPSYLFDANDEPITTRPVITSVSSGPFGYNAAFSVQYTSESAIASAVLVRPGS